VRLGLGDGCARQRADHGGQQHAKRDFANQDTYTHGDLAGQHRYADPDASSANGDADTDVNPDVNTYADQYADDHASATDVDSDQHRHGDGRYNWPIHWQLCR
jgi:hypothetical protein